MAKNNLIELLKGAGSMLFVITFSLGALLIGVIFFVGIAKVSAILYPLVSAIAGISILAFIFLVLPLSLFQSFRPFLSGASVVISMIWGVSVWMFSFLVICGVLGFWGIAMLFFFQVVTPIAAIGLFFKGQWITGGSLLLSLAIVYGIRMYGLWLANLYDERERDKEIYDTEVIEDPVKGSSLICPKCSKTHDHTWKVCLRCSVPLMQHESEAESGLALKK